MPRKKKCNPLPKAKHKSKKSNLVHKLKDFKDLTPPFEYVESAKCLICRKEIDIAEFPIYGKLKNKDKRVLSYVLFHKDCWNKSFENMAPVYMFTNVVA